MLVSIIGSCRRYIPRHVRFFYDARTKSDTIYAPSTEVNSKTGSPIGIIRLSGTQTQNVITKFTRLVPSKGSLDEQRSDDNDKLSTVEARYAKLTKVISPSTGDLIDIGMILWFPKPNSYTGEDVCEFHLHGSRTILTTMMDILGVMKGLRPAEPGEFTRRAVLNGKMSLLQAEGLHDLISSQTDYQRKLALKGLDGSTRFKYEKWIETLVGILAHLEASIDFGEDELIGEESTVQNCVSNLINLSSEMDLFIKTGTQSKDLIANGVRIAILGRPNVGKSTFMNLLCRREKSIVSDLSGTTRDIVEHQLELGGHAVILCDTAGLKDLNNNREIRDLSTSTSAEDERLEALIRRHDEIELEGVKRALKVAESCIIVLYLVDGSKLSTSIDEFTITLAHELQSLLGSLNEGNSKQLHIIVNKIDLNTKLSTLRSEALEESLTSSLKLHNEVKVHFLSCMTQQNFQTLVGHLTADLDALTCCSRTGKETSAQSERVISELNYVNERHLSLLRSSHRHLEEAGKLDLVTIDEMAQHVRESLDYLSRIVGSVSNEQVFDVIFRDFCIGK